MIDINKLPYKYFNDKELASYIQRQIIVHSILYYEMSENVIEDRQFDRLCKLLLELESKMKKSYKNTQYYCYFYDFKGETGYYLYDRLSEEDREHLSMIARTVLLNYKKGK